MITRQESGATDVIRYLHALSESGLNPAKLLYISAYADLTQGANLLLPKLQAARQSFSSESGHSRRRHTIVGLSQLQTRAIYLVAQSQRGCLPCFVCKSNECKGLMTREMFRIRSSAVGYLRPVRSALGEFWSWEIRVRRSDSLWRQRRPRESCPTHQRDHAMLLRLYVMMLRGVEATSRSGADVALAVQTRRRMD
jgi:hypothetical protein